MQRAAAPTRANHDVAWHVYAGGVLLDGGAYGTDVIDNNPPLVYWLAMDLVALARLLGAPPLKVYGLAAFGLAIVSAWLSRRLLEEALPAVVADGLALALLALLTLLPGFDFAQRDPIVVACLLPYLFSTGLRASGTQQPRGLGLAIGLLAGFGICLKPHYALLWLGMEAWLLLRGGGAGAWWRCENLGLAGTGAVYIVAVLLWTPSYLDTAREAFRLYGTYGHPVPWLSLSSGLVVLSLAAVALLHSTSPIRMGRIAEATALAAALAWLALALQAKDFSYHHVPPRVLALSALLLAAASRLGNGERRARLGRRAAWVVAATVIASSSLVVAKLCRPALHRAGIIELAALIEREAQGRDVLVFASSVDPLFPALVFTDSHSASPYSCLWLIAGHYERTQRRAKRFPYRTLGAMSPDERRFVESFVGRAVARRPRLLLFETTRVKQSFGLTAFDFERYFRADPRFGPWLDGYERLRPQPLLVDGLRRFDVWRKRSR